MKFSLKSIFATAVAAAYCVSFGAGLGVGHAAPPVKVLKWVKGKPVNLNDGGVHVVEFWATWCGPCRESIPHLTELAKKFKGKADFTGVSVYEHGNDYMPAVEKFVKDMGAKMAYNVAADGPDHTMAKSWMEAAGQNGIPTAFVVGRDGKIQWIGHPMAGLEEVVGQVVAGTFDAKAEAAKQAKAREDMEKRQAMFAPLQKAMVAKDYKTVLTEIDKLVAQDKGLEPNLAMIKYDALLHTDEVAAYALAAKLADGPYKSNGNALNNIAWSIAGDDVKLAHPDYALAIRIGEMAVKALDNKDAYSMDTLAYAYFKAGDKAKAIEVQTKALALAEKSDVDPQTLKEMKDRLAKFKAG
jgi:thiol-disulfide isomerase/thioredoxin